MNQILSKGIGLSLILQASGYYLYLDNTKASHQIQNPTKNEFQREMNAPLCMAAPKKIYYENKIGEQNKIDDEHIMTPNQINNQNEIYDQKKNNLTLYEDKIFQSILIENYISWNYQDQQIYESTSFQVLKKHFKKQDQFQKNKVNDLHECQSRVNGIQEYKKVDFNENQTQVNKFQEHKQNSRIEKQNEDVNLKQDKKENLGQIPISAGSSQEHQQICNIQQQIEVVNHQQSKIDTQFDKDQLGFLLELVEQVRHVEFQYRYYIRQQQDLNDLSKNYSLNYTQKKKIQKYCNGMIPVKGDGNCFYTAFGFQLLQYFLRDQNYYEQIKEKYMNIDVQMEKNQKQMINDKLRGRKILKKFFYDIEKLLKIKDKDDQNKQLFDRFAAFEAEGQDCDGFFNALTVIYLRNLAFKFVIESDEFRDVVFDKENLLKWEKECNNNEPIIKLLADNLKIHVNLLFFDNRDFNLMEYGQENDKLIILLMKPGHYNIGVKNTQ